MCSLLIYTKEIKICPRTILDFIDNCYICLKDLLGHTRLLTHKTNHLIFCGLNIYQCIVCLSDLVILNPLFYFYIYYRLFKINWFHNCTWFIFLRNSNKFLFKNTLYLILKKILFLSKCFLLLYKASVDLQLFMLASFTISTPDNQPFDCTTVGMWSKWHEYDI